MSSTQHTHPDEPCVSTRKRLNINAVTLSLAWGAVVSALLLWLTFYSQTPGAIAAPPATSRDDVPLSDEHFTLVMAIHPECPCTSASLYELERLIARSRNRLTVHFLFYYPSGDASAAQRKPPIGSLAGLDNVTWEWDPDGLKILEMGCQTSGSVVLYDSDGNPQFWGGITTGRGHAGDNLGSDTIFAILMGRPTGRTTTPVFGCSFRTPTEQTTTDFGLE